MILSILASVQHLRVPMFNSAEHCYFGLVAGKGEVRTLSHFTWILVNIYFVQWGWWRQGTSGLYCQPHALLRDVSEE